ncbi:MAG TPA: hypothetical protein VJQ54_06540 [Candidatus Sulfotelmatobacter sp.]|nr:hypothetical protein [Candidatus Sulfotelmatobacter sp.]
MNLKARAVALFRTVSAILAVAGAAMFSACAGSPAPKAVVGTTPSSSTHVVDLSWAASTSSDVSAYNVYRAPYSGSCGAFSKLNPTPIASTAYTDSHVAAGTSYCYATTAVSASNSESSFSNIVSNIQIPQP